MNTHGEYIIASVRRLGLSAFRIILILSALRILETGEIPTKLTCTDENFSTALTTCNTLMVHTGKIFSTLPKVEDNPSGPLSSSRQQQFLNTLPEETTFTRQTYLQIAETLGIPVPSADRYINRWVSSGMFEKVGHGEFRRDIWIKFYKVRKFEKWQVYGFSFFLTLHDNTYKGVKI